MGPSRPPAGAQSDFIAAVRACPAPGRTQCRARRGPVGALGPRCARRLAASFRDGLVAAAGTHVRRRAHPHRPLLPLRIAGHGGIRWPPARWLAPRLGCRGQRGRTGPGLHAGGRRSCRRRAVGCAHDVAARRPLHRLAPRRIARLRHARG